jgi:hypothetical protein
MTVAAGVQSALLGDTSALSAYAAQLIDIRDVYRQRVRMYYAEERRWPDAPFWSERRMGADD